MAFPCWKRHVHVQRFFQHWDPPTSWPCGLPAHWVACHPSLARLGAKFQVENGHLKSSPMRHSLWKFLTLAIVHDLFSWIFGVEKLKNPCFEWIAQTCFYHVLFKGSVVGFLNASHHMALHDGMAAQSFWFNEYSFQYLEIPLSASHIYKMWQA